MATVEFDYKGVKTTIQCSIEDKIKDIIQKFLVKIIEKRENLYFLYNGQKLVEDSSFGEVAKKIDKDRQQMNILVSNIKEQQDINKEMKLSQYIICPECKENIRISIKDFKINLYECKNGHNSNEIELKSFCKTQYIDESEIKCGNNDCKNTKKESYQNKFYICINCNINLCPLCQTKHDQSHFIIDYTQKDFICPKHCDNYNKYCYNCKHDICAICETDHMEHKTIYYGTILPNKNELVKDLNNTKDIIRIFKENIDDMISKLNTIKEKMDDYYNIYNNIINNYDMRKKNYYILQNINDIKNYNIDFIKNLANIINNENHISKFTKLMELYDKIGFKKPKNFKTENDIFKYKEENTKTENEKKDNTNEKPENFADNILKKSDIILEYNPSDNKYENFNINEIKELKSFKPKYKIYFDKSFILNDGRLLTYYYSSDNKEKINNKMCVYNIQKDIICDIEYDIDENISNFTQMNDGNIIGISKDLRIFKLKEKSIEQIKIKFEDSNNFEYLFKLSNNKILIKNYKNEYATYSYKTYELKTIKDYFTISNYHFSKSICVINENQIAIYYSKDGKLFGENGFILFYDIKNLKEIKTLKLGNYERGNEMILINNNLIVELNDKLILIDINNTNKKKELKFEHNASYMNKLNEKTFLVGARDYIYQFEIKDEKITLKGEREHPNKNKWITYDNIINYPGNKIIVEEIKGEDYVLVIYGS